MKFPLLEDFAWKVIGQDRNVVNIDPT
ncbi:unnamed protein product [Victoria cruziana]